MAPLKKPSSGRAPPSFIEFVAMMAAAMALHAASTDAMLPALLEIGRDYAVANENRLQWVVTAFVMGAGAGQLIYGPLSDRYGRRRVLLAGLAAFVLCTLLATVATSLPALLAIRVMQGLAIAAASVLPRSIIRDQYTGATMARVTSTIFMVFMIVPIVAPSVGQALLLVVSWRGIFGFLALLGACTAIWVALRLPETLAPADRRPLSAAHLARAARFVVTEPASIYYTLALTFMGGALLAYISTVPQIFATVFHRPALMAPSFALCAGGMAVASFGNSRIVERVGMHRVSHLALAAFIGIALLHTLVAWSGAEGLAGFVVLQTLTMGCFGLAASNFGAIAMQPMGAIAGSAASLQGMISTIGGAAVASLIGQQWSGSLVFLPAGALLCGLAACACVLLAERTRRVATAARSRP